MLKGTLLGSALGLVGLLVGVEVYTAAWLLAQGNFDLALLLGQSRFVLRELLFYVGPATAILAGLLTSLLRRPRFSGKKPGARMALGVSIGIAAELVYFACLLLYHGGSDALENPFVPLRMVLWSAAAGGGVGVGIGSAWFTPRPEPAP